jgi:hypothetical protein
VEKNNSSAMAKNYWLELSRFYKPGYYSDYITNKEKRLQTGDARDAGEEFWKIYVDAYREIRESGKLILRAKVVANDDEVVLYQIYESQQDRLDFMSKIPREMFHSNIKVDVVEESREISAAEKDDIIDQIIAEDKVIIQHLRPDHYRRGIVIGDPLKSDNILRIE